MSNSYFGKEWRFFLVKTFIQIGDVAAMALKELDVSALGGYKGRVYFSLSHLTLSRAASAEIRHTNCGKFLSRRRSVAARHFQHASRAENERPPGLWRPKATN